MRFSLNLESMELKVIKVLDFVGFLKHLNKF